MNVFESSESSHIHVYVWMIQTSYLQNFWDQNNFGYPWPLSPSGYDEPQYMSLIRSSAISSLRKLILYTDAEGACLKVTFFVFEFAYRYNLR